MTETAHGAPTDFSEAIVRIAELALLVRHGEPIHTVTGAWRYGITDARGFQWDIAVNGHREPVQCPIQTESTITPFTAHIFVNGWPFGIIDPAGGVMGNGEGANEELFLAAVAAETERVTAERAAEPTSADLFGTTIVAPKPAKPPTLYVINANARKATCAGEHCDAVIYWVQGRAFPLSADCPSGIHPNSDTPVPAEFAKLLERGDGLGVSHYINCPDAKSFSGRRRGR